MIFSPKTIALGFLILHAIGTLAHAQSIVFTVKEDPSPWWINGEQIVGDDSKTFSKSSPTVALDGDRCQLSEDGLSYFPVTIGFKVPNSGFAATEEILAERQVTLELKIVFAALTDQDHTIDLDYDLGTAFSVGREHRDTLQTLSRDNKKKADEYVAGLIHAIFLVQYYNKLLEHLPGDGDTGLWLARKERYAGIAADFLSKQHKQRKKKRNEFSYSLDPIVLPEGDVYELLKSSLNGRPKSFNTLTETRFRTFSYVRDQLEKEPNSVSVGKLSEGLRSAAKRISSCLTDTRRNLRVIDEDLYNYLKDNNFYMPGINDDLLAVKGFNLWRNLYLRNNRDGVPDPPPERSEVINNIFGSDQ